MAKFYSKAELMRMPIRRLQMLDIQNGEQETLVQSVLTQKRKTAPLPQPVKRGDIPDILNGTDEAKYQKIIDAREKKYRTAMMRQKEVTTA